MKLFKPIAYFIILINIAHSALGETFSLLTSNVLLHSFYLAYSNNWVVDVKDRLSAFNEAMFKAKAQGIDVLCFQEWPYGTMAIGKEDQIKVINHAQPSLIKENYYDQEIVATKKEYNEKSQKVFLEGVNSILETYFPSNQYYHLRDSFKNERDGILLIVSKEKFTLLGTDLRTLHGDPTYGDSPYFEGKILYAAHLAFKTNLKKTVTLLTAHLPFFPLTKRDIYIKNFALMKKVVDSFDTEHSVLCGDFNFNSWDPVTNSLHQDSVTTIKDIFNNYSLSTDDLPYPTALGGGDNVALLLDYVLYSKNLKRVKAEIYPQELKEKKCDTLIPHTTSSKPVTKMFYSDHAILLYQFDL